MMRHVLPPSSGSPSVVARLRRVLRLSLTQLPFHSQWANFGFGCWYLCFSRDLGDYLIPICKNATLPQAQVLLRGLYHQCRVSRSSQNSASSPGHIKEDI
jgi:hypothetical protein